MANKQKAFQKGQFKKYQSEKSQRNVKVIKHFHPNIQPNKYHQNCDIPEINADIETKENLSDLKKVKPSTTKAQFSKTSHETLTKVKDVRNRLVHKIESNHIAKAESPKNKILTASGSSSSKEYISSVNSLLMPNIRSSMSSSTSPSRANSTFKKKNCQTKKTQSTINNKEREIIKGLGATYGNDDISCTNIVNSRRKLILDLKKEIIEHRLENPVPYSRRNNVMNSANESVEHLRNEIKNLINTNLIDKRKRLAEIRAEIVKYQGTGDVHVYNVNIENNKQISDDQTVIENETSNDNAMTYINRIETGENHQQVRCSRRFKRKSKSVGGSVTKTDDPDNDGVQVPDIGLYYPGTDDSIKSKIEQTNELIHKLQQTLNDIRCKSHPSTPIQGITTTDTEAEQSSITDIKSQASESDKDTIPYQQPEQEEDVEVTTDNISSPKSCAISHNETVIAPPKPSTCSSREDPVDVPLNNIEIVQDLSRPKTRRSSKPDEIICCEIERFQNTPKIEAKAPRQTETEFQILQAKLNTINEQTESDMSSSSEVKRIPQELEASSVPGSEKVSKDSKSRDIPSTTISTQCETNLTIETPHQLEIPPKTLNKTAPLVIQLLPPLNINTGLALQKLMTFSIDSYGKTHFQFKNDGQNVGYYEAVSPSLAANSKRKTQSIVKFSRIVSLPIQSSTQNLKESDSDSDTDIDFVSNNVDESLIANYYPRQSDIQTEDNIQRHEPDGHQTSDQQQLKVLYSDDMNTTWKVDSNITVDKLNRTLNDEIGRNHNKSSNLSLVDDISRLHNTEQSQKDKTQKSVSDPEVYRTVNEYPTSSSNGQHPALDKDMVYKSFQLFKNNIDHDPGSLSMYSADMISNIDDAVYRTYINPEGFNRHILQVPTGNKINQKISTLGKLSAMKFSTSDSQMKKESAIPETETEIPASTIPKNSSKLQNIGLYSSKSVQSNLPLDEVALVLKKRGQPFIPENVDSNSEISFVPIKSAPMENNSSYDRISLTISYSTDESSNESSPIAIDSKIKYSKTKPPLEEEEQIRVIEPNSSNEGKDASLTDKFKVSHVEIPQDVKKFKQLKKKITEEHNIIPSESFRELTRRNTSDTIIDVNESIPTFITGLIDTNVDDLHKLIPHMRKTVQGAKKKMSLIPIDKKEESSNSYTVQTLQLRNLPDFHSQENPLIVSPLVAGKNGRYKDEENIFCENTYPRIEETLERRFKFNTKNLQHIKHLVDSSNSDTITSDKSFSEGEIQCRCSISIGEMHRCEARNMFSHCKPNPFQKDRTKFRKKKSYFDNCVTYYFNKNVSLVNDSSSTS